MSKFYKDHLGFQDLNEDNRAIRLSKCLELIEKSNYKDELLELFDFSTIENDFVTIRGLGTVMNNVIQRDRMYKKMDLSCHISNVSCAKSIDQNTIELLFHDATDIGLSSVTAKTVYSSKKEFFEGFYKMDKFANFCISEGHFDLLQQNVEHLNKKYADSTAHEKSFRLLKNRNDEYFVRAITSTSHYYDYNIRFSLFVTIIALYNVMKKTNLQFSISYCEYSESFIRVMFRKSGYSKISGLGELSFVLEMSNDEIKREAFKFSGLFTITAEDKGKNVNVFLKPKRIKTKLISIKHNFLPSTVIEHLEGLADFISEAEKEMQEDILELSGVKNPDHLRFYLLRKVEKSQNLSKYKKLLKEKLDTKITKISELIILMGKVDEVVEELELKEYLRYLFYEILRGNKDKK